MRIFTKFFWAVAIIFFVRFPIYSQGWRGVVHLHSTRHDVIKVLGPPEKSADLYNLTNEVVLISYSTGKCDEGGVWNVPPDTVIRITVSPKGTVLLSQLQINLDQYEKIDDKHLPGIVYYNNPKEGIHLQTNQNKVTSIQYLPSASDNHLRCATSTIGPPITKSGETIDSHTLFDSYGRISFISEKQRLDLLGHKLRELPGARAYIVAYTGPRVSLRQALSRASRAKRYLIRNYNLGESSIEVIRGGALQEFTIRLYLVPREESRSATSIEALVPFE
jgi:hypothetical protein